MKESVYCLIPACLLLFSCVKIAPDVSLQTTTPGDITQEVTSNNVSMKDVINIVGKDLPTTKAVGEKFTITPYIGSASDTLMYIVNNKDENGWTIYSSDKRTPAILAKGDTGSFSLENGSPALAVWMSHVANDIARVRRSTDAELSFSEDEILANKAFWGVEQTRFGGGPYWEGDPPGHWEESISSHTVEYDHFDHMVAEWDQDYPYNECCPYYVNTPSIRACAGCVAIAGSQVLLYLHDTLGVPANMYSDGYCVGDVSNFQKYFSNQTSTVWSSMNYNYQGYSYFTLPEAILISYVGALVEMHYWEDFMGEDFSWALPGNLKTNVFEPYGISCAQASYNENIVKSSLLNQMPVIVSGSNLLIPVDGDIHTFVIDGYQRTRTEYVHHHYYVLDGAPGGMYVMPEDYYTYTYSTPELTSIKINWGWRSQWISGRNDGWYALTGGWTVLDGNNNPSDYNYHLTMIYGFSVAE